MLVIYNQFFFSLVEWLDNCLSVFVYELLLQKQVFFLYALPFENILGKIQGVLVGDTCTIPFSMRQNAQDIFGAAFDTTEGAGDGSHWKVEMFGQLVGPWEVTRTVNTCQNHFLIHKAVWCKFNNIIANYC